MRYLCFIAFAFFLTGGVNLRAQKVPSSAKIDRIHENAITIDSHTDTPMWFLTEEYQFGKIHDARTQRSKIDIPRMEQGGLDGIFLAVFTGQQQRNDEGNISAKKEALQVFDSIYSNLKRYPGKLSLCLDSDDIFPVVKNGKRAVFIGLENAYPIGRDISLIDTFYALGARYFTLCHTLNNDICDSSTDPAGAEHGGVSEFGEEVIRQMNRKGIMIDISHASDSSFYDAIKLTKSPLIASHSCARTICDNPRNMTDDMLLTLAENGGVIQMCILSSYVKTPVPQPERDSAKAEVRKKFGNYYELDAVGRKQFLEAWNKVDKQFPAILADVSDVADHIDHIVKIAGINHVEIGTDFDGGGGVEGCFDVSEIKNITAELVRRGYNSREIKKIWGGNLLRVFSEVEKISKRLS